MRVRPQTKTKDRPRRLRPTRRTHQTPAPPQEAAAAPEDHLDERRARESGGPLDRAQYACSCGYVFDAEVSTSVSCPHCGTPQAW